MSSSLPRGHWPARVAGASLLVVAAACDSSFTGLDPQSPSARPSYAAGLSLDRQSIALRVGSIDRLRATATDRRGATRAVDPSWRTEDPSVVTIADDGTLIALQPGHATVWARSGLDSAAVIIDVAPSADGLTPQAPSLATGSTSGAVAVKWLALSSSVTRLAVGTKYQFQARAIDASGTYLSTSPAFVWRSSNVAVATVDPTGLVKATGIGQTQILVRQAADTLGAQTSVVLNVVDATAYNTASVSASPTSAKLSLGGTQQIVAVPRTKTGVAISGRTLKYSSSNSSVATVSTTGLIRAIAAGAVSVIVACDGVQTTVPVTVTGPTVTPPVAPPTPAVQVPARVSVTPASVTLLVGASQALTATVFATDSSVIAAAPITWSVDRPTIATVATDGKVTAVSAGSATVTATSGSLNTTVLVQVNPASPATPTTPTGPTTPTTPPPIPVSGNTIPLQIQRFDGGSGAVMVSNGIPLTPGTVTSANLSQVHVLVNGTEQQIYVKPLAGHFKDGSLRAILVQFDYSVSSPVAASLVIGGGARTQADLAARPAQQLPTAAALPTDPAYLVATRAGGALYAPAVNKAPTSLVTQYEGDYARLEAADWKACGTSWSCGRTAGYDKAFITYQQWLRTGDATYWYHATAEAADYLKNYIIPNASPTPWWSQSEGVALHYWATGDETTRYQLRKIAEMLAWAARPGTAYQLDGTYGDDRFRARVLFAALDAAMLEISTQPSDVASFYSNEGAPPATFAKYLTATTLDGLVSGVLSTQKANGMFGGTQYGGGQSNYMVGMLLTALTRYYDEVNPDPRIAKAVKACIDDMWANEWSATGQGFDYNSQRGTLANSAVKAAANPLPGLNGLIATPFAWYARVSGDASYDARVDTMLAGLAVPTSRSWWASSGKAFDEAFYRTFNTFAYRAGMQ